MALCQDEFGNVIDRIEPNSVSGVLGVLQELLQHGGFGRLVSRLAYLMAGKNEPGVTP